MTRSSWSWVVVVFAVGGNKNAALPMICATLLIDEPVVLRNVPDITDVRKLVAYFRELGSRVDREHESGVMRLEHAAVGRLAEAPPLPAGMRSSLLLLPASLGPASGCCCTTTSRAAASVSARSIRTSRR